MEDGGGVVSGVGCGGQSNLVGVVVYVDLVIDLLNPRHTHHQQSTSELPWPMFLDGDMLSSSLWGVTGTAEGHKKAGCKKQAARRPGPHCSCRNLPVTTLLSWWYHNRGAFIELCKPQHDTRPIQTKGGSVYYCRVSHLSIASGGEFELVSAEAVLHNGGHAVGVVGLQVPLTDL